MEARSSVTCNASTVAPPQRFVTLPSVYSGPAPPAALADHSSQQHESTGLQGGETGAAGTPQRSPARLLPVLTCTNRLRALLTVARLSRDSPFHGKLLHHDGMMNLDAKACMTAPLRPASCHAATGVARGTWVTVPAPVWHLRVRKCTSLWGHRVKLTRPRTRTRKPARYSYVYTKT